MPEHLISQPVTQPSSLITPVCSPLSLSLKITYRSNILSPQKRSLHRKHLPHRKAQLDRTLQIRPRRRHQPNPVACPRAPRRRRFHTQHLHQRCGEIEEGKTDFAQGGLNWFGIGLIERWCEVRWFDQKVLPSGNTIKMSLSEQTKGKKKKTVFEKRYNLYTHKFIARKTLFFRFFSFLFFPLRKT